MGVSFVSFQGVGGEQGGPGDARLDGGREAQAGERGRLGRAHAGHPRPAADGHGPPVRADDLLDVPEEVAGLGGRVADGGGPDGGGGGAVLDAQHDVVLAAAVAGDGQAGGQVLCIQAGVVEGGPGGFFFGAEGGQDTAEQEAAADAGQQQAGVRQHVPPGGPAGFDDGLALCWRECPGHGTGQDVRGTAGVEQLVGAGRADADGGYRVVVPGYGQDGSGCAFRDVVVGEVAGGLAGQAFGREDGDAEAGGFEGGGPRRAGVLVDEAGAGGQRGLADRFAA